MTKLEVEQHKKYADQVVSWLAELGYTHCFFVAGGNIMHLLDGVRRKMLCIPFVHEVSAAIAVEYFNESNGNGRAFALVTAGPGVSNVITAMSGAWLESRELLVIAGQVKSTDLATNGIRQRGIQEIDGVGLTKPISKESIQVRTPIPKTDFSQTVLLGRQGRPGPIFIEFCLDAQGAPPLPSEERASSQSPVVVGDEVNQIVNSIAEKLRAARRPILLLGGGISRAVTNSVQSELQGLTVPIMTTWNAADRVDSRNANYFGRPNTWGQRSANLLLAQADVIIALGTRLGLQQTGFNWQEFGKNAFIVHVDIDPAELEKGHPTTQATYCVDANAVLTGLLKEDLPAYEEWTSYSRNVRDLLPLNDPTNTTSDGFVSTQEFFEQISQIATEQDILIPCSSGGANSVAMQLIGQKSGQIIVTNKGLASMGYGLAGAIGASLAHQGSRTMLFEGDGGFAQNLQELATVAVNNLPIKIFIFANNGYGSIRMTQKNYFGGAYLGCDTETGLGFPDWTTLFKSFGIDSMVIDADWTDNEEVQQRLNNDQPCGFIVPTDPLQTYWPKIQSRVIAGGGMESNPLYAMSPDLESPLLGQVSVYLNNK
jgi:acetolactate synthase-1/2/3 large subunit